MSSSHSVVDLDKSQFLVSLLDLIPDIVYIYDLGTRKTVYSNTGAVKLMLYSQEEIVAMGDAVLPTIMHPEDFKRYTDTILPSYARAGDNEVITYQFRMRRRDQVWRYMESRELIYSRNPDNAPHQIFGTCRDITDRVMAEEALRESMLFFKETQKAAFIGSYRMDFVQGLWESSDVLDEIFGIDKQFSRSVPGWLDIVHQDDREIMDRYLREEVIGKQRTFSKEYRIKRISDGAERWVHGIGKVKVNDQGRVVSMYGTIQDITDRKKTEMALTEILQRDKETLEQLVNARTGELVGARVEVERLKRLSDLGVLSGTVAHELRNPLAAIKLAAYNIRRKVKNELVESHLKNIETKVQEGDQIINNLLSYAAIKPPQYEEVNISDVVNECLEMIQFHSSRKKIVIERAWDDIKDIRIKADPLQMKELFHNIVNNAIDAVPAASGKIRVSGAADTACLRVVIQDNGPGISPEVRSRLYSPFFSTKAKGTGLGLVVSKQIVELHCGSIEIESSPAEGTAVAITLPRR